MTSPYETLTGRKVETKSLAPGERKLLRQLMREYEARPSSDTFAASWTTKVIPRVTSLPAGERTSHPLYLIAQDLELRLGVAEGSVAPPDYRDYIMDRIEVKFGSRYKFCKSTGISQAALSQVLAGHKDFSLGRLQELAEALDLTLALLPAEDVSTSRQKRRRSPTRAG